MLVLTHIPVWFAAREVMGGWPAAHGEPHRREDILSNCYQSVQPVWLRLQQGSPTEDPQRLAANNNQKLYIGILVLDTTFAPPLQNNEISWFLFFQWPPDTAFPSWQMKSTATWWVELHIGWQVCLALCKTNEAHFSPQWQQRLYFIWWYLSWLCMASVQSHISTGGIRARVLEMRPGSIKQ